MITTTHKIELQTFQMPLAGKLAWELESFLVKIFEYGDYPFRAALRGEMSPLKITARVAMHHGRVIGVALGLYPPTQQRIALIGPIGVDPDFRQQGIATKLINQLCDHLAQQGISSVYLAAKLNHPARALYHRLEFQAIQGIVMQRPLTSQTNDDETYFRDSTSCNIRQANWSDYCGAQQLLITPATMICFDYQRGLFSSRVTPTERYFSVFPDQMKQMKKKCGLTMVLVSRLEEKVMGLSHVSWATTARCPHQAVMDFFVHDHFMDHTQNLLFKTIKECNKIGIKQILCYVPQSDELKINCLEQTGAILQAKLPRQIQIDGQWQDTLIYSWQDFR